MVDQEGARWYFAASSSVHVKHLSFCVTNTFPLIHIYFPGDMPSSMVKKIVVPPGFHENVNFELIDPRETAAGGSDTGNNNNDAVSNCGDSDCGSDINGLVGNSGNSAAVRGGGKVKSDPFIAPTRILYGRFLLVMF